MTRVHPIARIGLARILLARAPQIGPEKAVRNADDIIKALHQQGLQVGPLAAFGANADTPSMDFDAIGVMAEMFESEMGRKPWRPD